MSGQTVKSYFEILEDTLLGRWLPAFTKRPKRRVIQAPKFYFADVGVVNTLARRGSLESGGELYGRAFENWVHHELEAHLSYSRSTLRLSFWRLAGGTEVDFIVGDMDVALEAKATERVTSDHLKGLRQLSGDHEVPQRVIVCLEPRRRLTEDGILVLPAADFAQGLPSEGLLAPRTAKRRRR